MRVGRDAPGPGTSFGRGGRGGRVRGCLSGAAVSVGHPGFGSPGLRVRRSPNPGGPGVPRALGHLPGKSVNPVASMVAPTRAACEARCDPDLAVIRGPTPGRCSVRRRPFGRRMPIAGAAMLSVEAPRGRRRRGCCRGSPWAGSAPPPCCPPRAWRLPAPGWPSGPESSSVRRSTPGPRGPRRAGGPGVPVPAADRRSPSRRASPWRGRTASRSWRPGTVSTELAGVGGASGARGGSGDGPPGAGELGRGAGRKRAPRWKRKSGCRRRARAYNGVTVAGVAHPWGPTCGGRGRPRGAVLGRSEDV